MKNLVIIGGKTVVKKSIDLYFSLAVQLQNNYIFF